MLQFHKLTHEEAIRKTLMDDPSTAGTILTAETGSTLLCKIIFEYEIPANFAKAVLADVVVEGVQ